MNLTSWTVVWQPIVAVLACIVLGTPAEGAGIYRWSDSTGNTHYGDDPPTAARALTELTPTPYDSYGIVATVIDGDTVILTDGRRVRLLGIDAPEIAHHGQPGEPLGEKARKFLKFRVESRRVQLRYDLQYEDPYNRLLAHLYLEDGQNLNALLIQEGLAYARFEWPNLHYAAHYYEIEKRARNQVLGIWSLPSFRIKPMENLEPLRNRFVRLRGRLERVEKDHRYVTLIFDGKLRAGIKGSRLELFRNAGLELDKLTRRSIVLRGWLGQRRGAPYIELSHPFQLEQVE